MVSKARGAAALITAMTAVLALAWGGTAVADGDHHRDSPSCASGEARGDGTAVVNTFTFDLCRTGDAPTDVTGTFEAAGIPPSDVLVAPRGPITCAEIDGNTVSFVYPLGEGSRPAPLANVTEVLITATDGGPGGTDGIVFSGPVPIGTFGATCGPLPGLPQPVTAGDITVTDRG